MLRAVPGQPQRVGGGLAGGHLEAEEAERGRDRIAQEGLVVDHEQAAVVVSTYVAYLRRKLARHGPDLIHTQRAVGYSLRLPRPADPDEA